MRHGPPLPVNRVITLPGAPGTDTKKIVQAAETNRAILTTQAPARFKDKLMELCQAPVEQLPADLPPVNPNIVDLQSLPAKEQEEVSDAMATMLSRSCPFCNAINALPYAANKWYCGVCKKLIEE